tara:strand:- start:175 stop:546 length:372 start_codon:yes stop_codon:yes gene_type:complete
MANPNLVNATTLKGHTVVRQLDTTTTTGIVTCPSDTIYKINAIYCVNIDGTTNADLTVKFHDDDTGASGTDYDIASTIVVPNDSTLTVIAKDAPIYLEEGDEIRAGASANGDLNLVVSFDEIS